MSSFPALQTQMASVMETLVHAAVAELGKLVEDSSAFVFHLHLSTEEEGGATEPGQRDPPAGLKKALLRVQRVFASTMETLGNEALGRLLNMVEDMKVLMDFEEKLFKDSKGKRKRPQTSVLNILSGGGVEEEHCYGRSPTQEHVSVQKLSGGPVSLALCRTCHRYHCPFCPPAAFKPSDCFASVFTHVESHRLKAVLHREFTIFICHLGCCKRQHFHCPHCLRTFINRATFLQHLTKCEKTIVDEEGVAEEVDAGFVLAVSLKDEHGDIDLEAIATRAAAEAEASLDPAPSSQGGVSRALDLSSRQPHNKVQDILSGRGGRRLFVCPHCGKALSKAEGLRLHLRVHTGEKPFACGVCERRFARRGSLRRHARTHTGERPHACPHCPARFAAADALRHHGAVHTRLKPYPCTACGKTFSAKKNLARHVRTHSGEKAHSCDQCGKGFTNTYTLKHHKMKHMGDTPFKCPHCPKAFTSAITLRGHQRVHKAYTPLPCDICGKKLRNASSLKIHTLMHTKPFKCKQCDQGFHNQSLLKAHSWSHSGKTVVCEFCDKTFNNPLKHQAHVRTHVPEKPYCCNFCQERFASANGLVKHVDVHHTQRDTEFECKLCGDSFSTRYQLSKHKQQTHPAKPKHYDCRRCGRRYPSHRSLKTHECVKP